MTDFQETMLLMSFCVSCGVIVAFTNFAVTEIINAIWKKHKERKRNR